MKIAHHEEHVKGSHGLQHTKTFGIRQNAHAFKMLSSGLYSDKITAVLREIGCNATDAHIAAGIPHVPIEVKLPNRIDNQFHIRDMGPGLSDVDVMELYTTYFASTKQTSNDFTGAFGLGSKSPFSYVDSFTIVSVHSGKMRTYSAHLDNAGMPTIALLTTEEATPEWPSGVSIKFAVKPGDYPYFAEKAQRVFQWFKTPPKILGAPAIAPLEITHEDADFLQVKDMGMSVLMGNVCYPLDIHQIEGLSQKGKCVASFAGIVLKVPIGDVLVAASREELQFDKASMKRLGAMCEKVVDTIANEVAQRVMAFGTATWDDKCKMKTIQSKWTEGNFYIDWHTLFNHAGLASAAALASTLNTRALPMPTYAGETTQCRIMVPGRRSGVVEYTPIRRGQSNTGNYSQQANLALQEGTKILYGHAKHTLPRARFILLNGDVKQLVLITPPPGETDETDAKREALRLSKDMAGIEVAHIDTVPVPPTVVSVKNGGTKVKKPRNAHQAPLPSKMVSCLGVDGSTVTPMDIALVKPADQHFMCQTPRFRHGADKSVRAYNNTTETDKAYDAWAWAGAWKSFIALQDELGMPDTRVCMFPMAAEIQQLDLVKRGWRLSSSVVVEWATSKAVRDQVAGIAARWRPTVDLNSLGGGWVPTLIDMRKMHRQSYDAHVEPHLPAKVRIGVVEIHDASVKAGKMAGANEPKAVSLYNNLRSVFPTIPALPVPPKRTYLSITELESDTQSAFPLLSTFDAGFLYHLLRKDPPKLAGFTQFLFS